MGLRVPSACAKASSSCSSFFFTLLQWETWAWLPSSGWIPPAHTDVLLSQSPVLCGCLLFIRGWPQDAQRLLRGRKAISFLGCALQQWFFGFFVAASAFYWHPWLMTALRGHLQTLLYSVVMSHRLCIQLVVETLRCWISEHHDPHNSCF